MKREDDFEKQLMKDNLTIKEQIANLQKTISRLKNDMIVSEKNENKHIILKIRKPIKECGFVIFSNNIISISINKQTIFLGKLTNLFF